MKTSAYSPGRLGRASSGDVVLLGLGVCVPVGVEVDDEVPEVEEVDDADDDADDEADEDDAAGEVVVREPRVDDGELVTVWVVGALLVELE